MHSIFLPADEIKRRKSCVDRAWQCVFACVLVLFMNGTFASEVWSDPPYEQDLRASGGAGCATMHINVEHAQTYEIEWRIRFKTNSERILIKKLIGVPSSGGRRAPGNFNIPFSWSVTSNRIHRSSEPNAATDGVDATVWHKTGDGFQILTLGGVPLSTGHVFVNVCVKDLPGELQSFDFSVAIAHYAH